VSHTRALGLPYHFGGQFARSSIGTSIKDHASAVRHTNGHLFHTARARVTFSRMSVALAVQIKGLGF
jgi:hypothetical protein